VEKGFALEGCILILATWNAGRFSKVHSKICDLRNHTLDCVTIFPPSPVTPSRQSSWNRIEAMFNRFSKIKGVEYTGGPKVMHLMLPELFVPWDAYIRGRSDK
jgi:hypothetical protein